MYCEYDAECKKRFSLREISTAIAQKFNKKVNYSTVGNWAKKYDWDKVNEKIKQQSILKANNEKFSTQEKLIEAESDKLAIDYKNAETLANNGFAIMAEAYTNKKEHPIISVKDALTAIRIGTDIKFRISGLPQSNETETKPFTLKINDKEIKL